VLGVFTIGSYGSALNTLRLRADFNNRKWKSLFLKKARDDANSKVYHNP